MVGKGTKIPNPRPDVKQERCTARTYGSSAILWSQMGRDGMQTRQNLVPVGAAQSRIHLIQGLIQPHLGWGRVCWWNEIQMTIGGMKMIRGSKVTQCVEDGVLITVQKITGKRGCARRWTLSYNSPQTRPLFKKIVKNGSDHHVFWMGYNTLQKCSDRSELWERQWW